MPDPTLLFHYGALQPFWQQHGLIQARPRPTGGSIDQFETLACKASRRLWPMLAAPLVWSALAGVR
jgi:hypothetical protein